MATVVLEDLAQELGIVIDKDNPQESFKQVLSVLKDKAAHGEQLDQRMEGMENQLTELLALPALQAPPPDTDRQVLSRRAIDQGLAVPSDLASVIYGTSEITPLVHLRQCNDLAYLMGHLQESYSPAAAWRQRLDKDPTLRLSVDAMAGDSAGYGAEWVPTGFSNTVWEDVRLNTVLAATLNQVAMPTDPFKLPYKGGTATAYATSQATDITTSKLATTAPQLDAKGFGAALYFSGELDEDAVFAVLPLIQRDLAMTVAEGAESCLVNGDTTGTHQDSDVTGAADVRKLFKGLRKLSLAVGSSALKADASTFTVDDCLAARAAMGKYGVRPADLIWAVSPLGLSKMMGLEQTMTLEKYGLAATILTGELAKLFGIPVLVSGEMRDNLNASGVYDGSTATKTAMHLYNRRSFAWGTRRQVRIEGDKFVLGDYQVVVAKGRFAFVPDETPSATHQSVYTLYNMS